jgi:hypothetical protein
MINDINTSTLIFICLLFILILLYVKRYNDSPEANLTCKISRSDNNKYCIRPRDEKKIDEGIELISGVVMNCKQIVKYLEDSASEKNKSNVSRLISNFKPTKIFETLPSSTLTAYSENKGEKIAICLNKDGNKDGKTYIDKNTLTYVALHELAHLMTVSIGHKKEFWENFKYLLKQSELCGIYTPIDYTKQNQKYCGDIITDNPYYDKSIKNI